MWSLGFVCLSSFWFIPNASIATDAPWKSHHRFCTWVCVCKRVLGVVNAFSLPSSSVPSQNCEDQTTVAVSWQCVCWSLSCAWLSFNTPSLMSWTTLCHLLSLLLLLIFPREGMFSLGDLTCWERKLGLWGYPRKVTFLQEWRGKPSG